MNPPCRANPNCIPRNPKLMFQICQKLNFRFSIIVILSEYYDKHNAYQNLFFVFEVKSISFNNWRKYNKRKSRLIIEKIIKYEIIYENVVC